MYYPCHFDVGDIVFTCIDSILLREICSASLCWSNHVGIVIGHNGEDYLVAESKVPFSKVTTLKDFIRRSAGGRYAVRRIKGGLQSEQQLILCAQVPSRMRVLYHTGFNLDSRRQFCSKFVYEIYRDALGVELGRVETFENLLHNNPEARLTFWKLWFFGLIPWQRRTVTPASLWCCDRLETLCDETTENSQPQAA